ncbi:MAG: C-terminal binding protein [Victivallaceae bacterium]|nr:C-terminal binding protein [Victivallaceae bacterium]
MKVLRLNARTFPMIEEERQILRDAGAEVVEVEHPGEDPHEEEIDAVLIVSAYLRSDDIDRLLRCRVISRLGNGCDKIDLEAAARRGIMVVNVPDSFSGEVADHTMALMLSALRKLKPHEELMRQGRRPSGTFGVRRIRSLTLGLIGFGRIGREVACRAKAFGMKILVADPALTGEEAAESGVRKTSFDQILDSSDVIALLCPLLESTRGMLSGKEFKRMKKEAILINTARGELVNEADLAEALENGVIAWAGLDVFGSFNVFVEGGFPTTHPLFKVKNIQMTPHVSANAEEAKIETFSRAAQYAIDVLRGVVPPFVVNKKLLEKYAKCKKQ